MAVDSVGSIGFMAEPLGAQVPRAGGTVRPKPDASVLYRNRANKVWPKAASRAGPVDPGSLRRSKDRVRNQARRGRSTLLAQFGVGTLACAVTQEIA